MHALVEAFQNLNGSRIRYTWPRFLPTGRTGLHPFLGLILPQLFKQLNSEALLENWAGQFDAPKNLCLVPLDFLDDDGHPLLMADNYLSSNYAHPDISPLVTRIFAAHEFIALLESYAKKEGSVSFPCRLVALQGLQSHIGRDGSSANIDTYCHDLPRPRGEWYVGPLRWQEAFPSLGSGQQSTTNGN